MRWNKRLRQRLGVYHKHVERSSLHGHVVRVEDHYGVVWFGKWRPISVTKASSTLEPKPTWEFRFTLRGDWTLKWDRR